MAAILIKLVVAPVLVAVATLAGRRWGARVGGIVSAFPAIVGPLLLIVALEHGAPATARTANGILLGLVALAAFALAYGRCARGRGWALCLVAGWASAALSAGVVESAIGGLGSPGPGAVAAVALLIAARGLRFGQAPAPPPTGSPGLLLERMAAAALLVAGLSAGVSALGATAGGMLAALPVVASLLATFTHREAGGAAAIELLRGTLFGMAGFVLFCQLVAVMVVPNGAAAAFAIATLAALLIQAVAAGYPAARNSGGRSGEASASACLSPSASRSAA